MRRQTSPNLVEEQWACQGITSEQHVVSYCRSLHVSLDREVDSDSHEATLSPLRIMLFAST